MPRWSLAEAHLKVAAALAAHGAKPLQAEAAAAALVRAEADGQAGHGLSRVASYCAQLATGKVQGAAAPILSEVKPGAVRIDAGHGFAYPALDLAVSDLPGRARRQGIAAAAIHRSHHFGQAGAPVERLAEAGCVALVFGNSPKAIPFPGGKAAMLGTNPLAFAAPLAGRAPLVIDLALSVSARGKILAAQKAGQPIPEGWALDAEGLPTTDPTAALGGSMLAIGGIKGAAIAMAIELLAAALTGAQFGFEATSLFTGEGPPPDLGQTLIALDPESLSGGAYEARMGAFLGAVLADPGVRLPGERRLSAREAAAREGLDIAPALATEIAAMARH